MGHKPHHVAVLAYEGRATASCSCGELRTREHFGDNRVLRAKLDISAHLERIGADEVHEEYQIPQGADLDCPICNEGLDLKRGDFGLLRESEPSVVQCKGGHEFDAYVKKTVLFLFPNGSTTNGPFSTTE